MNPLRRLSGVGYSRGMTKTAAAAITTTPYGSSGTSELVYLNGLEIGDISGTGTLWLAQPTGARFGTCKFGSREHAIAACESYALRQHWKNEL